MTRERGTLTVTVVQARGVPKTDLLSFGDADPFVVFTPLSEVAVGELPAAALDPKNDKVQRTQVGEPVNPIWHETFKFVVDVDVKALYFHLFDADRGLMDEHLGTAVLSLASLDCDKEWVVDEWVDFKGGKANGAKAQLLVHFQPQDRKRSCRERVSQLV